MGWRPFKKYVIGRPENPYLTRWDILGTRYGSNWLPRLFLHRFHRSDLDAALHDHPWGFVSLILTRGYWEERECPETRPCSLPEHRDWYPALSIVCRRSTWKHRIIINPEDRGSVYTLVLTGPKIRDWGFWCPKGWTPWKLVADREDKGEQGCE